MTPPKIGHPGFRILGDLKILDRGEPFKEGVEEGWWWTRGEPFKEGFAKCVLRSMTRSRRGVFVESKSLFRSKMACSRRGLFVEAKVRLGRPEGSS